MCVEHAYDREAGLTRYALSKQHLNAIFSPKNLKLPIAPQPTLNLLVLLCPTPPFIIILIIIYLQQDHTRINA